MSSSDPDGSGLGKPGLRKRAEELLGAELEGTPQVPVEPTEDLRTLVHELQVYQIELEIQNEELRVAQIELADSRDRYMELYEFAPVGYLTIDTSGVIREANLAFGTMLGVERQNVVGASFSRFIAASSQDVWHLYSQRVFDSGKKQSCELDLGKGDDVLTVRLEGIISGHEEDHCLRVAVMDISVQKESEMVFSKLHLPSDRVSDGRKEEFRNALEKIRLMPHALSHLSEGVLISEVKLDLPGPRIIFANKAICEMTGYREEELLGSTPRMLQGKRTDQMTLKRIRDDLLEGRSTSAELINYRKDGQAYHTEIFIFPVVDESGERTHFISIQRDTTERKRAEDALRLSEERFRKVFECSAVGIAIIDRNGRFEQCNQAYCELLGYSEAELLEQQFVSKVHPDDRYGTMEASRRLLSGEIASYEVEHRHVRKGGGLAWGSTFLSMVHDGSDESDHMIAVVSDVTEHRRVFRELRDREERLAAIMSATADAIITIDTTGEVVSTNPAALRLFGYSDDEMTGVEIKKLLPPTHAEALGGFQLQKLEGGARVIGGGHEVTGRRKDGTVFPAELVVSRVDNLNLFTGIIRDVTRRRELEDEVINASENERLNIAYDLHDDLGSLLTGIKLGIESMAALLQQDNPVRAGQAKEIAGEVSQAMAKTRAIAAGLRPVGPEPEDLMGALEGLARRMKEAGEIEVRFVCPSPVLIAEQVMANHLFRIAQEAVSNAVKHSGGNLIIISLLKIGEHFELRVEDNGSGLGPVKSTRGGIGLHAMSYRANALRGSLRITGGRKGGARVACLIPNPEFRT